VISRADYGRLNIVKLLVEGPEYISKIEKSLPIQIPPIDVEEPKPEENQALITSRKYIEKQERKKIGKASQGK